MFCISLSAIQTSMLPPLNRCWEEVLFMAEPKEFPRRSRLVFNTMKENYFYFLSQGRIAIVQDMENGKSRTISTLNAGTLVNVTHSLARQLTDFIEKGCYCYSLTDITLYRFDGALLQDVEFINRYPHLIANLMASLSIKILAQHSCISNFGTGGAQARICRFCMKLSEANGGAKDFAPGISQTQVAHLLGMDRATLVRLLQKLRQLGVVLEFNNSRLVIGDVKKLRQLSMQ